MCRMQQAARLPVFSGETGTERRGFGKEGKEKKQERCTAEMAEQRVTLYQPMPPFGISIGEWTQCFGV